MKAALLTLLHLAVTAAKLCGPGGVRALIAENLLLCRMFNDAIRGQGAPRHLSTDHDRLFEDHRWQANVRVLEINEIKTVPYVPLSHPFVERLIGTVRREFLDQVIFWNTRDLERKLADFQAYYNAARSHASLAGNTQLGVTDGGSVVRAKLNNVRWLSHGFENCTNWVSMDHRCGEWIWRQARPCCIRKLATER